MFSFSLGHFISFKHQAFLVLGNHNRISFLLKYLEDISPFSGAGRLISLEKFWWHFQWGSKPEWIPSLLCFIIVLCVLLVDRLVARTAANPLPTYFFKQSNEASTGIWIRVLTFTDWSSGTGILFARTVFDRLLFAMQDWGLLRATCHLIDLQTS